MSEKLKICDHSKEILGSFNMNQSLPVGNWSMWGNVKWYVTKRPRWLTRLMMRWFFEWEWNDEK